MRAHETSLLYYTMSIISKINVNGCVKYFLVVCFIECQHAHTHEDDLVLLSCVSVSHLT